MASKTDDFRIDAVVEVINGKAISVVARERGVSETCIYNWKRDFSEKARVRMLNGHRAANGTFAAAPTNEAVTLRKCRDILTARLDRFKQEAADLDAAIKGLNSLIEERTV
jgi:transposase